MISLEQCCIIGSWGRASNLPRATSSRHTKLCQRKQAHQSQHSLPRYWKTMDAHKAWTSLHVVEHCNVRHDNDGEVQPVPGVPQEGEGHDAESSGKDLDGWLESVNGSERVPGKKETLTGTVRRSTLIASGLFQQWSETCKISSNLKMKNMHSFALNDVQQALQLLSQRVSLLCWTTVNNGQVCFHRRDLGWWPKPQHSLPGQQGAPGQSQKVNSPKFSKSIKLWTGFLITFIIRRISFKGMTSNFVVEAFFTLLGTSARTVTKQFQASEPQWSLLFLSICTSWMP